VAADQANQEFYNLKAALYVRYCALFNLTRVVQDLFITHVVY
jgi:hypothetical protein